MVECSVISPSYFCSDNELLKIKKNLIKIGFDGVKFFNSNTKLFSKWAGYPEERLNFFYDAWNSVSKVLMCCRGGSGVAHFLPLIKKKLLKKSKLFIGYSDITLLLNFINQKLKIITFHGPHGLKDLDSQSLSALRSALQMKNYGIKFNHFQLRNISVDKVKGKLIGGNLERLVETISYLKLNFKNKIVFLEEVDATEFRIFNNLIFLKNYTNFKPKAILFGNMNVKKKILMKKMINYLFLDIPVIYDLPFGHQTPNITIPIGADCEIDFNKKKITFLFSKKDRKYAINFVD
ncbi:MAG: LD-carboxypeptidase [Candidatus Thorarchaeota archaeon]